MFELGEKVSYVRQISQKEIDGKPNPNYGKIVRGKGLIVAVCVDVDKRKVVRVKDGDAIFNVDFNAVNYTPEFEKAYKEHCEAVQKTAAEGRLKQQAVVAETNKKIVAMQDFLLGTPLEL